MNEKELEAGIKEFIEGITYGECVGVDSILDGAFMEMLEEGMVRTFEEAGVLTNDPGLVVSDRHGNEFQVTIVRSGGAA